MAFRGISLVMMTRLGCLYLASSFVSPLDAALVELGAGLRSDDGNHALAEIGVRHADHGALGNARQSLDDRLDLGRIDVIAACNDQILGASDDRCSPLDPRTEVARNEKPSSLNSSLSFRACASSP